MANDKSSNGAHNPTSLDYIVHKPGPLEPNVLATAPGSGNSNSIDRPGRRIDLLLHAGTPRSPHDSPSDPQRHSRIAISQRTAAPLAHVLNNDQDQVPNSDTPITLREVEPAVIRLPELPPKRGRRRAHVLPPTLQGLHQPPPDAGLLPSISVESRQPLLKSSRTGAADQPRATEANAESIDVTTSRSTLDSEVSSSGRRSQRNRWTEAETADLMKGVARFGIGGWKRILTCSDYSFNKRTAVDLKDRFRVCRPDAYQGPSRQAKARTRKRHARSPSAETTDPSHADSVTLKHPLSADVSVGNGNQHQDVQGSHLPHSHENFFKIPRRSRNMFTEEDDMHLLQGFMRHGKSWQSIQRDPELHLCRRKPTDLRDRFRIRYPEMYAQTGLAPRPTTFPKPQKRSRPADSGVEASAGNALEMSATTRSLIDDHRSRTIHPAPFQGNEADNYFDDLFADDEEHADGPITLDRSIIDETLPSLSMTTILRDTESSALFGIDPLDTLRLPPLRPP